MDVDRGNLSRSSKASKNFLNIIANNHKNYGILMSNWEVDVIGLKEYNFNIKKSIVNATD